MICIPVTACTTQEAINELKEASKHADVVELRIDYIKSPDLNALLKVKKKPVIVTNRPKHQGGLFAGDEESRISLLKKAVELNADYIDLEYDCVDKIKDLGDTKLIVSYHNFDETPKNVKQIHKNLTKSNAHIVKLVTFANDITDNFYIFDLLNETDYPTIAFCMGELGQISRILSPKFGGKLVFASLTSGKESAPGQLTIDDLTNIYHVQEINNSTQIFGLLGNPVAHSKGHYIHNALFKEKDINAVYMLFKVENIATFIDVVKKFGIDGLSVTIPHKESVIKYLDEIDPIAKKIGAVNTVINRNGKLVGHNTDCPAAINALEKIVNKSGSLIQNKKVVIIGAGGAARALAFGLKEKGANIKLVNRTFERCVELADEVGCSYGKLPETGEIDADVLINTSSVGMYPNVEDSPVSDAMLKQDMILFDVVYNPQETKLLKDAKANGCVTLDGVEMFVGQAALQFELFTGKKPQTDLMKDIIAKSQC